jgi:hypothetical protein
MRTRFKNLACYVRSGHRLPNKQVIVAYELHYMVCRT